MQELASTPFFVVGSVRSGTTMFRLMLDHHPEINCFGEFEYAVDLLAGRNDWPSGVEYTEWLSTERRFVANKLIADPSKTYPEIAFELLRQLTDRKPRPVVGAIVHRHFEQLDRLWPEARYIYMVRDARDVAKSCVQKGWAGNAWYGAQFWEAADQSWERVRAKVPSERLMMIRMEDLVMDTEQALSAACSFVGVEFSPKMLEYSASTRYSPPDRALLYQWRSSLSPAEIKNVEARVGDRMVRYGYTLECERRVPNASRRLLLKIGNAYRHNLFRIKRYGLTLWISMFLTKRLGLKSKSIAMRVNQIDQSHIKK